jgi:TPR repeat protein
VDYGGSDGYVKVEVPIKEPFFDWVEEDGTTWDWEDREVSKLVTREVNEPYVIIEHEDTPGKGGKAGEYKGAEFQNVRGGEAVSITVGMGGNDVNGSNTEISVGGQSLLCRGGNRGEVNGLAGEASGKWSGRGSGGSGQAHYQTPTDRKGKDGYVQITTLGLRPIDSAIPLEASVKSALEREAASSGYANYILGVLHEKGAPNLVADMQEAIRYYRLAVAKGDTSGQYRLGMIYLCGNAFVAKHLAEGVRLLTLSAQQGHLPAKCVLGLLYTLGEGVGKNEAQGISFFQQAATSGHMKAQYFLGLALFTGHGVAKNPVEAMNWLERSANQGHGDAQYWLAYGYEKGIGVPANRGKAIEWYDKAGKINHPLALFRGGCLEGNMDPDNL